MHRAIRSLIGSEQAPPNVRNLWKTAGRDPSGGLIDHPELHDNVDTHATVLDRDATPQKRALRVAFMPHSRRYLYVHVGVR
jgi:hypothetical protein